MTKRKYLIYSLLILAVFTASVSALGLFKIGILSDTFGDAYTAVNSSVSDKISNNLEYIDSYRYRPVLFLTLKGIVGLNYLLGVSYDNFILYKLINLIFYLLFAFIAGYVVFKISGNGKLSLLAESMIIVFPNNLHNLCWSAAYFEILCGIFYLLSIFFVIRFTKNPSTRLLVYSNVLFAFSLLTKEIAITLPFISIFVLFLLYGKNVLNKYKAVYISQFAVLIFYFIAKMFLSRGIPVLSGKYFDGNFIVNSILIFFKGIISLLIPVDYSLLKIKLLEFDLIIGIYVIIILLFLAVFIADLIKQKRINNLVLLFFVFAISVSPYIYAGYIRPQLILLPFTVTVVFISGFNITKYKVMERFLIAILVFWFYWDCSVVNGWSSVYIEGKDRMNNLLKTDFPPNKKIFITGNPARVQQFFMFDNIMFPYNYFKYHKFIIKDSISDLIRTASLDCNSLNSELIVNKLGNGEYEISCTGKTQFFYLDGDDKQITENKGIKNNLISVDFLDYNNFGKPVKIKMKTLDENIVNYIFQGKNLIRLD